MKMFGQEVPIRAQVAALEQFSDHADTPELLEWLHTFKRAPRETFLVHGEPGIGHATARRHDRGAGMECAGGSLQAEGHRLMHAIHH